MYSSWADATIGPALSFGLGNMQSLLTIEISQMSVAERIQLAEDLWDSILSAPEGLPVTQLQKEELDHRLGMHGQNPEAGSSWEIVKERLTNQQ